MKPEASPETFTAVMGMVTAPLQKEKGSWRSWWSGHSADLHVSAAAVPLCLMNCFARRDWILSSQAVFPRD